MKILSLKRPSVSRAAKRVTWFFPERTTEFGLACENAFQSLLVEAGMHPLAAFSDVFYLHDDGKAKASAGNTGDAVREFQMCAATPQTEYFVFIGGDVVKFLIGNRKKSNLSTLLGREVYPDLCDNKPTFVLPELAGLRYEETGDRRTDWRAQNLCNETTNKMRVHLATLVGLLRRKRLF